MWKLREVEKLATEGKPCVMKQNAYENDINLVWPLFFNDILTIIVLWLLCWCRWEILIAYLHLGFGKSFANKLK